DDRRCVRATEGGYKRLRHRRPLDSGLFRQVFGPDRSVSSCVSGGFGYSFLPPLQACLLHQPVHWRHLRSPVSRRRYLSYCRQGFPLPALPPSCLPRLFPTPCRPLLSLHSSPPL